MDNQSVCRRSAGIHNTAGAQGGTESKWGLGVFHSIPDNDLHYEASEHFTRVPERVVVGAVLELSQNETWRHITCRRRTQLKRSIWNRKPKPTAASPPLPSLCSPLVSVIFTETGAKCIKRGDGNRPGGGFRGKCDYHQKNAMRPRVFNAQMHKKWYFITAWRLSKITGKGRKMCLRWKLWNACLTGRNRFNPGVSCPFHVKICFSDPWFD